jgi:hypothetical protein
MLRSVYWWLVIDVSGQPIGPVFFYCLTLEDVTDTLPQIVGNCLTIYAA